jgi:UDP-3-O-[3-hydroxymyristoyl] glucosamine N-acyltransferase
MKFETEYTLKSLAEFLDRPFEGPENLVVSGINEIHKVEPGDIVFVDHPKYYKKALESAADVILIDQKVEYPAGKGIIISDQPFDDFNKITLHHSPFKKWTQLNSSSSYIDESAVIAPNAFIGHNVSIGANSVIHAGAVIADNSVIGKNVIIGPNSVIGHDAF